MATIPQFTHIRVLRAKINVKLSKDWEINWGNGSEVTQILGGPRSRVAVAHYFQEPGTYAITIKTTDFNGNENSVVVGTYTVKAKVTDPLASESIVLIESSADIVEFMSQEETLTEPFVTWSLPTNESRFTFTDNYLSGLAETMRQRQMLDLDQSGQKPDLVSFTDLIWSDDELFGDEWMDFSESAEEGDFWSEVFDEDLFVETNMSVLQ